MDEQAILLMLQEYLHLYDSGDYIHASAYLCSAVETQCGGPTALALALSQNHRTEGIDYDARAVHAWSDDPNKADVTSVETYSGKSDEFILGLAFIFESGGWKLDDMYPIGAGAFCRG